MRGVSIVEIDEDWVTKTFDMNSKWGPSGMEMERSCFAALVSEGICPEVKLITKNSITMRRGYPLADWLRGKPSTHDLVRMARKVHRKIVKMHTIGINHRDLHIDNIVLMGIQRDPQFVDFEFSTWQTGAYSYDLYGPKKSRVPPPKLHEKESYHIYWDAPHPRGLGKRFKVNLNTIQRKADG